MRKFQRILFLIGLLFLLFFTLRHVYMRFFQPTQSVLDRFELPMKDQISGAKSLGELVVLYEAVDKKVKAYVQEQKKIKAQANALGKPGLSFYEIDVPGYERDPHDDLAEIRTAINEWEHKRKQSGEIYFYWLTGFVLVALGYWINRRYSHWFGTGLWIGGFAEMIYWSSPTFIGSSISESNRLLTQKTIFSLATLFCLILMAKLIGILKNNGDQAK